MSVAQITGIHAVNIDDNFIYGVGSMAIAGNPTVRNDAKQSEYYTRHVNMSAMAPTLNFQTVNLDNAFDAISFPCKTLETDSILTAYAWHMADGGTRASSNNRSYAINKGIAIMQSLNAAYQQDATLDIMAHAVSDGTNDPIEIADTVTLTSGADASRFTLHSIGIGSASRLTLTGAMSVMCDFGCEVRTDGADDDISPTHSNLVVAKPVIRINGANVKWCSDSGIPYAGKHGLTTYSYFYLRKYDLGGTLVATATEEHIKVVFRGMATIENFIDGQSGQPATCTIKVDCYGAGSESPPIVITTDTAIT